MKFGIATKDITPSKPVFLCGFGARNHPSEGVLDPPYLKVLLLQSNKVLLIITIDALGSDDSFIEGIKNDLQTQFGFTHDQVLINFSHTHHSVLLTGLDASLRERVYSISQQDWAEEMHELDFNEDEAYYIFIRDSLIGMVKNCQANLTEGELLMTRGQSDFAVSRRLLNDNGHAEWKPNYDAKIDRDLFVFKLVDQQDTIKGIIYSYGCHPTSMGPDNYLISNDFAGETSSVLEKRYIGSTAFFLQGCAGDLKPVHTAAGDHFTTCNPQQMREAGRYLAEDIISILEQNVFEKLNCHFDSSISKPDLPVQQLPASHYEQITKNGKADYYKRAARRILSSLENGASRNYFRYYIHVLSLSEDVRIVALKGEVCTAYGLLLKKYFSNGKLIVLGYSNGVLTYIPTRKMIKDEGGYEVEHPYTTGLRGPFEPEIEDIIVENVTRELGTIKAISG